MTIYACNDMLDALGKARAEAAQRAWFLVQDTSNGRRRLTDNPGGGCRECVVRVFTPTT
jgi:hypothetical protein